MTTATISVDEYWHFYCSDCSNTLIYAHTTSRTLETCDIILGSLALLALEAGRRYGINRTVTREKLDMMHIHSLVCTSTKIVASVALLSPIDFAVLILTIASQDNLGIAQ
jgi:hypothetical protein